MTRLGLHYASRITPLLLPFSTSPISFLPLILARRFRFAEFPGDSCCYTPCNLRWVLSTKIKERERERKFRGSKEKEEGSLSHLPGFHRALFDDYYSWESFVDLSITNLRLHLFIYSRRHWSMRYIVHVFLVSRCENSGFIIFIFSRIVRNLIEN